MSEWKAFLGDDYEAFNRDAGRVHFFRHVYGTHGEELEEIVGWGTDGWPITERRPGGVVHTFEGFMVPKQALAALAEVLKPGPSQGEIRRLEDALAVERARTETTLAALLRTTKENP